ncbi:hypothetical protein [Noviherbaspirillum galbum]|uniref:Uncharacterized protein n=1 Tax=Noviherbaspirillum galbum TaxID=2709383 RepID=A0A6B3SWQ4_9BURK|nr:hypothetical protein [Noviherbaspirillum galbum]NEX62159.1 hypothetical protein [Noviherbaspirillum galbum]
MTLAILMHYHTVAGMLLPVGNSAVDAALKKAAGEVGEKAWRSGFSGFAKNGATEVVRAHLALLGLKPKPVSGRWSSIKLATTHDEAGNDYHKVRMGFEGDGENVIVSLDLASEMAQRLSHKLINAQPGEMLAFNPFSTLVNKGGRAYANHAVGLKRGDGTEVAAPPNLWTQAQALADDAERALRELRISDRPTINRVKALKKMEFHLAIYRDVLVPRFAGATRTSGDASA